MLKKVSNLKYFIECLFYWFAQVYVALLGPVRLIFFQGSDKVGRNPEQFKIPCFFDILLSHLEFSKSGEAGATELRHQIAKVQINSGTV